MIIMNYLILRNILIYFVLGEWILVEYKLEFFLEKIWFVLCDVYVKFFMCIDFDVIIY